jgi:hypothetical protein
MKTTRISAMLNDIDCSVTGLLRNGGWPEWRARVGSVMICDDGVTIAAGGVTLINASGLRAMSAFHP